jgi:hypothetical protein
MNVTRRNFNNILGRTAAGLILLGPSLISCSKNPVSSRNGKRNREDTLHGSYETFEDTSNEKGELSLISDITKENFNIITQDDHFKGISTEIKFYCDNKGNVLISSLSPDMEYLPGFYLENDLVNRVNGSDGFLNIINFLYNINEYRDISAKFLDNIPSFDEDHLLSISGIKYMGNWSFNQARNLVEFLNYSSMILVPVFPGLAPISIATNILDNLSEGVDYLIDFINSHSNFEIDKDEKFEFYSIPFLHTTFFLPRLPNWNTRNVRDYMRLDQGDWWVYTDGYNKVGMEVEGFKKINGINIPITRVVAGDQIAEVYQKFTDEVFLSIYGNCLKMNDKEYEFIFRPPIVMGDDRLGLNRTYPNYPTEINSGVRVKVDYVWEGIDGVTVPYGRFDDCWKVEEKSEDNSIDRWFARGVGQVMVRQGNYDLKLDGYGEGGLPRGILSLETNPDVLKMFISPLRQHL